MYTGVIFCYTSGEMQENFDCRRKLDEGLESVSQEKREGWQLYLVFYVYLIEAYIPSIIVIYESKLSFIVSEATSNTHSFSHSVCVELIRKLAGNFQKHSSTTVFPED